jgi:hypothetical protein
MDAILLDKARESVRKRLMEDPDFADMPREKQKEVYKQAIEEEIRNLSSSQSTLSTEMKKKDRGIQKASDLIDDTRHEKDFTEGVDAFEDLVDSVDFPQFVADLLKAVFDANISVMKAQTDDYIRLMKEATTGLASFIKQIDNTTTFAYLAESKPDEFNLSMEEDEDGNEKMELTNPQGEKVDMEDNEVKAKIMDAKIKMAQEHRAALREMILMGITRLVVEKGEVEAEVNFEFKGKRVAERKDKAMVKTAKSTGTSVRASGGLLGAIFGGPRGGHTSSTQQTQLSVSSAKSTIEDELKAKLRGYVNIKFKTDYFKLDNFANMYGPASQEEQKAAAPKTA